MPDMCTADEITMLISLKSHESGAHPLLILPQKAKKQSREFLVEKQALTFLLF